MDDDPICGFARKLGVRFGRWSMKIKRSRQSEPVFGDIVASSSTLVESPVGDVMHPINVDDIMATGSLDGAFANENAPSERVAPEKQGAEKVIVADLTSATKNDDDVAVEDRLTKVLVDVVRLQDEIGIMRKGLNKEDASAFEHIGFRLEEILERSGATPIAGEQFFDIRRHRPNPMRLVKDGEPIVETLKPGWRVGERILRRALVHVKCHHHYNLAAAMAEVETATKTPLESAKKSVQCQSLGH